MTFRVGQKVVCVDDYSSIASRWQTDCPAIGLVYTIREFEHHGREPALRLIEIINKPRKHFQIPDPVEPAFALRSFRPIVSRKTDISIFTEMLTKIGIDA